MTIYLKNKEILTGEESAAPDVTISDSNYSLNDKTRKELQFSSTISDKTDQPECQVLESPTKNNRDKEFTDNDEGISITNISYISQL